MATSTVNMKIVGYKDYMDKLQELYPDIDRKSLGAVVRHGMSMLTYLANRDIDVQLRSNTGFWCFIGYPTNRPKKILERTFRKRKQKQRLMYRLRNTKYSGYRYLCLGEENYQKHLRGEPQEKAQLVKIAEEAGLVFGICYILRVKSDIEEPWVLRIPNYDTTGAELVNIRNKAKKYEAKNKKHIQQGVADGLQSVEHTEGCIN